MSYGLEILNSADQLLISSEFKNLHFKQKKTSPDYVDVNSNGLFGGVKLMRYRFNVSGIPVPFFYVPLGNSCAVTSIRTVSSGVWDVEILTNGANPEVYIFVSDVVTNSTDTYGLQVFNANSQATFDSRAKPLVVTNLLSISQPSQPSSSYSSTGFESDSCGTSVNTYHSSFIPNVYTTYNTSLPTKPLFFFSSNAQAEREVHVNSEEKKCDTVSVKGNCAALERTYTYDSYYWAFYRNVITWTPSAVGSTWCVANWGCHWNYVKTSQSFGIATGGANATGGAWPFTNENVNTFNNTVIIGDASLYD